MDLDGEGSEYEGYHVSKETEEMWAEEFLRDFWSREKFGREALKAYSTAVEFVWNKKLDVDWTEYLYYPLRAGHLDDVTRLFMLGTSFRMAERAAKKNRLTKDDVAAYIEELDRFIAEIRDRADRGAITRSGDYVMNEFADPEYVESYLNDFRKKWTGLH